MDFSGDGYTPLNGELTALRIGGARQYDWPAHSQHLQRCVKIDFLGDTKSIANQDAMDFEAIKPIGPTYEYRDYGIVQSLQKTLRSNAD